MAANQRDFGRWQLRQQVLRDVSRVDTETDRRLPEGHELRGQAAAIGIRKGKPFSPDERLSNLLGGLLGAAYLLIGPATIPLIGIVFFTGYMAFESYARLREAQESTIRGFIKALEAKDLYTRGHTERVARFAEMIGKQMGYDGTQLERLRWAALIHDVGKLAVDALRA